jgi:hypothetical protein
MKILHINQSDIVGGAAIASYRLHQGLLSQAIDSKMLVELKKTKSDRIEQINRFQIHHIPNGIDTKTINL